MKKIVIFVLYIVLVFVGCAKKPIYITISNDFQQEQDAQQEYFDDRSEDVQGYRDSVENIEQVSKPEKQEFQKQEQPQEQEIEIPSKYLLAVPFTSQAPHANWDQPYQDACEEASLIMAAWYFRGEKKISKASADSEIQRAIAWENVYFGYFESTDTKETAEMAQIYFDLRAEIITDVTVDSIKRELLKGHLVIVPTTGRTLGNPYYTGEGPLYHMLVISGWNKDEFITNDPGTRKGEEYHYKYDTIIKATHDWNSGDIYNGRPMFLSVWK